MPKNKNLSGGLFAAKPTALTQKESSLSAQIAAYLSNRGIYNERLNSGKVETKSGYWIKLCERGTPDRIAIVRGQAIFIETKILGEKPTKEQLEKHDELRDAGAIVIVADSYGQFVYTFAAIRAALEEKPREINLYD
jgi:hypothetical protein